MQLKFKHVVTRGLAPALVITKNAAGCKPEPRGWKHEFGAMRRADKRQEKNRWVHAQAIMQQLAHQEKLARLAAGNAVANAAQRQRQRDRVRAGHGKTFRALQTLSAVTGRDAVGAFLDS